MLLASCLLVWVCVAGLRMFCCLVYGGVLFLFLLGLEVLGFLRLLFCLEFGWLDNCDVCLWVLIVLIRVVLVVILVCFIVISFVCCC